MMALIQLTKHSILIGGGPAAAAASGGMGHSPVMMHAVRVASGTKIKVNLRSPLSCYGRGRGTDREWGTGHREREREREQAQ